MKSNQSAAKKPVDLEEIPDSDLRDFKENYLPAFSDPHYRKRPGTNWRKVDHGGYVTEAHLRGHLASRYTLGYPGHSFTKWIGVDIDRHHGESDTQVYDLAGRVIETFPTAQAFPVQSSGSGGVHVYFFLAKPSWSVRAVAYSKDQLVKNDISLNAPSGVEVYPICGANLRMPFGEGSYRLDIDDFVPLNDNVGSLHDLIWLLKYDKLEPLEIPPGYEPTAMPGQYTPRKSTATREAYRPSEFMERVDGYLTAGLTEPSTRNTATLAVNWYLQAVERRDRTYALEFLNEWIRQKHNNQSRDFLRDPESVYRKNAQIVEGFDISKVTLSKGRGISRQDRRIIERHVSQTGLRRPERQLLGHILVHCRKWWDVSGPTSIAEIPAVYLHQENCDYRPVLDELIRQGHIRQISGYSVAHHQCRKWAVQIPAFPDNLFTSAPKSYKQNPVTM